MAAKEIGPWGVLGLGIALVAMWSAGIFDQNNVETVSDAIQTNAGSFKDIDYASLLKAGQTACNIDKIVLSEMKKSGVHDLMLINVGEKEQGILLDWVNDDKLSRCDVAILNDMFPNDSTGNVWRNQIGINKAMKNIQACTILDCIEEYGLIEILE